MLPGLVVRGFSCFPTLHLFIVLRVFVLLAWYAIEATARFPRVGYQPRGGDGCGGGGKSTRAYAITVDRLADAVPQVPP